MYTRRALYTLHTCNDQRTVPRTFVVLVHQDGRQFGILSVSANTINDRKYADKLICAAISCDEQLAKSYRQRKMGNQKSRNATINWQIQLIVFRFLVTSCFRHLHTMHEPVCTYTPVATVWTNHARWHLSIHVYLKFWHELCHTRTHTTPSLQRIKPKITKKRDPWPTDREETHLSI